MPRKGYRYLTVTEKVYQDIKTRANEADCSMKEYIEHLLATERQAKEGK